MCRDIITYMLNSDEVRTNEWYVVNLSENPHDAAMVNARYQNA